jgi:hypothetical protein
MKGRLFTFLSAASLLLCMATCVLWVRSYRNADYASLGGGSPSERLVLSQNGHILVYEGKFDLGAAGPTFFPRRPFPTLFLAYWVPAAFLAAVPATWVMARPSTRRRARSAAGLCAACGYDLRASPGRCPECGAEPTADGKSAIR